MADHESDKINTDALKVRWILVARKLPGGTDHRSGWGRPWAGLLSELVWAPLSAGQSPFIT